MPEIFDKTILIVDDLEDLRDRAAKYFLKKGFKNVFKAANSKEAFEIIEKIKPNLIILDIQLKEGDVNGIEILRRIKAGLSPDSIVVMLSGHRGLYEDECANLGAVEFWEKPILLNVLTDNVKRVLSI